MSVTISPLNIVLDKQNPRFVVINDNSEATIRKYMSMYEDVCQLAEGINNNRGLLLGERIVVIEENDQYVVMEGNRRTVALQFLLNRDLIPDGFQHKVPFVSNETLANIKEIEIDVAPNRQYAIALMAKRHIQGVKDWKPLAKKQFFASMFNDGSTVEELSMRTGIKVSEIRKDIRDYKLLLKVSSEYKQEHPEFDEDLITYKIDPFLRIFSASQQINGVSRKPSDILKMKYDLQENTGSELPNDIFSSILQQIFESTIVNKTISTRNTLFDVPGVRTLIESLEHANRNTAEGSTPEGSTPEGSTPEGSTPEGSTPEGSTPEGSTPEGSTPEGSTPEGSTPEGSTPEGSTPEGSTPEGSTPEGSTPKGSTPKGSTPKGSTPEGSTPEGGTPEGGTLEGGTPEGGTPEGSTPGGSAAGGGPAPGGLAPGSFFEHISWNKLSPSNNDHIGLIVALNELYSMSRNSTKGKSMKIYESFPVGAGMLLRTAYEQALILQLKKTGIWGSLLNQYTMPMLSNIESHIKSNITIVLPLPNMRSAFNLILNSHSRDFLNSNVHKPGMIRTTSSTLEGLASGGMVALIQLIIDNV
ncbi:proline-rich domain-containing protein [Brevibacillus brevis]|uniref:proline-rich domain-containing protein n=1 Tax=Brevibacillus brevis TaxID=1393 RepID=UPI001EE2BB7A|nr:proline-rich domain-containing protein [Brevibacillus brevis]